MRLQTMGRPNRIESPEFARTHLSQSVPGLLVNRFENDSDVLRIFEFEEAVEEEEEREHHHELRYNRIAEFDWKAFFSLAEVSIRIDGSTNGLLFLRNELAKSDALYICNPITREYIELPSPEGEVYHYSRVVTYGFGFSKMSGEYKVVSIYHERVRDPSDHSLLGITISESRVYTLGTGSWRSIPPGDDTFEYDSESNGVFLNGNLHWLVADLLKGSLLISCFNLETELFHRFPTPTTLPEIRTFIGGIAVLGDCLCICDNTSDDDIVIWVMKEYGVDKSWTKEFVISRIPNLNGESHEVVYPLKVFRDGDMLMLGKWEDNLFYYSSKTKTIKNFEHPSLYCDKAMLHTSSFVSLKSFAIDNLRDGECELVLVWLVSVCQSVVCLASGSWRSIPPGDTFEYYSHSNGMFLNGNLHWLVADLLKGSYLISCFNLETELFHRLSTPTLPEIRTFIGGILVFGDCLCICDDTSDDEIVIWVMTEYGVDKSWKKEFVINKFPNLNGESDEVVYPLKVFRDGDILMLGKWEDFLFYDSSKTKTTKNFEHTSLVCDNAVLHTSSCGLLKSFVIENVSSF
ncbi:hypothetical protein BUALT_Bualt08G0130900 [Buddleja alternifolia]|uniref:F-box associated domain-containing protein n=1 Tax=Buddleja alternifolia TaxID=168488 RepID=A0AAV6X623_9LAMI|nr:hypothetical protein BUALT_Bualt08G0130900 [Buddleja alternifolia]